MIRHVALPAYSFEDDAAYAKRVNLATAAEVRAAMARKRVNQTQLSKALGMSQPALSRRLTGDTPFDVIELAKIADLLGTEIQELARSTCFGTLTLVTGDAAELATSVTSHPSGGSTNSSPW